MQIMAAYVMHSNYLVILDTYANITHNLLCKTCGEAVTGLIMNYEWEKVYSGKE
jgi:hypothetical protein